MSRVQRSITLLVTPVTTITAWRNRLPRGETLPRENWLKRHRAMTAIAWAHVPALLLFALVAGKPLGDAAACR